MVLADGVFDPMHLGHVAYLRTAEAVCGPGEVFMIRVAPDADILAKGRQPFQTQDERAAMLSRLFPEAKVGASDSLAAVIQAEQPRVLVKGIEWMGTLPADVVTACDAGGVHLLFTATRGKSSTTRLAV